MGKVLADPNRLLRYAFMLCMNMCNLLSYTLTLAFEPPTVGAVGAGIPQPEPAWNRMLEWTGRGHAAEVFWHSQHQASLSRGAEYARRTRT